MSLCDTSLERFQAFAARPEGEMDLLDGALLIAHAEYPMLDRARYRRQVEAMAAEVAGAITADTLGRLVRMNRYLFKELGFHANEHDYYDPRNSFLNDVLERRTGIPISLCVLYIEVGRRAGLPLAGVGMPGHFLVGCLDQFDLFVDAYAGGRLLTRSDCVRFFRDKHPGAQFLPEFLAPVGTRSILTRMLNNLYDIYFRASRYAKALPMVERIVLLNPQQPEWLRQRAFLHYALKSYSSAARDLERYLSLVPDAPDQEQLAQHLSVLHHLRGMVN
jgi:regulator of sirC expression with transglutaminase-like and TPR domain